VSIEQYVTVRWEQIGFHCWPEAKGTREYLSSRHRHKFYFEVTVSVFHNDREIEFHDLLDQARAIITEEELGRSSCEDLAYRIIESLRDTYKESAIRRDWTCSVFEDNEVGATVTHRRSF